jgi:ribose 5-phosphate isomerase B
MRLYIGSDHAGYQLKNMIKDFIVEDDVLDFEVVDLGAFNEDSIDYPDIAREVAEKVYENEDALGILVCGSGTGMCMAANKHIGIRAAACTNIEVAKYARAHNNANVLCLGQRILTDQSIVREIISTFLMEKFEGGRHARRVEKMDSISQDSITKHS